MDDGSSATALLELRNVEKEYRGLRPLRIQHLEVRQGERLALLGFDQTTAELFVNLATGAVIPDAGEVLAFGQSTAAIVDADAWLASLDRFGILTDRAALLDGLSVEQNLALGHTLELDPIPGPVRRSVAALADELVISAAELAAPAGAVAPLTRALLRLGRALALRPQLLLAEHPNAFLPPADLHEFTSRFSAVASARRLTTVVLTADLAFARAVATRVTSLQPSTGELRPTSGWGRWFSR